MQSKKWYVVCQYSEESEVYGVVALTDEELAGAKKMLDYDFVTGGGGWCGGFHIEDTAYNTKEQARDVALLMAR